jgi:hypothetical protein
MQLRVVVMVGMSGSVSELFLGSEPESGAKQAPAGKSKALPAQTACLGQKLQSE